MLFVSFCVCLSPRHPPSPHSPPYASGDAEFVLAGDARMEYFLTHTLSPPPPAFPPHELVPSFCLASSNTIYNHRKHNLNPKLNLKPVPSTLTLSFPSNTIYIHTQANASIGANRDSLLPSRPWRPSLPTPVPSLAAFLGAREPHQVPKPKPVEPL